MHINSFFKSAAGLSKLVGTGTPSIKVSSSGFDAKRYTKSRIISGQIWSLGRWSVENYLRVVWQKIYPALAETQMVNTTQKYDRTWRNEHDMSNFFRKRTSKIVASFICTTRPWRFFDGVDWSPARILLSVQKIFRDSRARPSKCMFGIPRPDNGKYKNINSGRCE